MAPLWRKAPLLLLKFPGLLLPVAAAVAVLTLGAASQPLFVSSAASAALDHEFSQLGGDTIGLEIGTYGIPDPRAVATADEKVRAEAVRVPGLREPRVMLRGPAVTLVTGDRESRLPLLARTGALDHLIEVDRADNDEGVWIAASVAERTGTEAGDEVQIRYGDKTARVPVAGVYRDLADVLPTASWRPPDPLPPDDPLVRYWGPLGGLIVYPTPQGPSVQPPFILGDQATISRLSSEIVVPSDIQWTFPYETANPSLAALRRALPSLRTIEGRANDPLDEFGQSLRAIHLYQSKIIATSFLPGVAERVSGTVDALAAPVRALSLAAQGLALLVVAVAAAFSAQRRAVELRLLVVQGVSTTAQGAKAALEAVLPTVVGAVAGWAAAVALVRLIGPSPELAPDIVTAALRHSLLVAAVPIVVVGAVTAAIARAQAVQGSSRLRGVATRAPWEVVVLVLAAAAYFQVAAAGAPADDEPGLTGLVLLFPLLLIAGGAGLAARGLARVLPKLRGSGVAGRAGSPATYLARRRLAAAPGSALLLVAASALAIGVLIYAATAASTTESSLDTKAAVNVGSDVAVDLGRDPALSVPFPSTHVGFQGAEVLGAGAGALDVDVLAVDPETFAQAAAWSDGFASQPLDALMSVLTAESGERLPVLVTGGGIPAQATLTTKRYQLPVTVASRVRTFPGMSPGRPMVVVAADRLVQAVEEAGSSTTDERLFLAGRQWLRGDPAEIVTALSNLGVEEDAITTVTQLRSRPDLLARSWTLSYLQAVGVAAGLLAFIGTLLYLSARQGAREVAYVLARRMGLSAPSHRRSVALELAGMLSVATVTGAVLAILAARLLLPHLNPLPNLAPAPALALPLPLLGAVALAIMLACVIGAAVVQRAADRARVSEVLRLAA